MKVVVGFTIGITINDAVLIKKNIAIGFLEFFLVIDSSEYSKMLNS